MGSYVTVLIPNLKFMGLLHRNQSRKTVTERKPPLRCEELRLRGAVFVRE